MRLLFVALGLALIASPAAAAGADQAANDLSTEIMSPFCPGVTLHECPSAEAIELRNEIEEWFRSGSSEDEIMARLEAEYGRGIRAAPAPEGMGLAAWVVSGLALMAAVAVGAVLIRKWSRGKQETPDRAPMDATDRLRLDEELARYRTQS